jgi:CheY-like chemotaxis protein
MCDRVRIRQVLLNLVSNAVRFTSAGGITVGILREGDDVVLSVSDTGAGIRGEDTERIFEPFFQSSTPGESRGGSGLGLSISRQFVELHHGQMWVESALGLGTTFYIRLPITPPRTVDSIAQRWLQENWVWQQRTSPVTLPRSPHKERVMVFDDTGSLAPVIARLRSDLEFVEVRSLDEAEQRLADVPAHVFLANVPTPAHLLTFAESAQKRISDTPIVVCSYQTLLERPLQAGASGYLTKPVVADKLVAALRTLSTPIRKVLIVDDNEDLQRLLARMLRSYDGSLQIATVADGRDALPEIRRLQPDLILLDLALPNLDGWQILEQKAADPAICDITTLIISAQDLAEQPMRSPQFVVGMQGGTAPKQLLESALLLSRVLLGAT